MGRHTRNAHKRRSLYCECSVLIRKEGDNTNYIVKIVNGKPVVFGAAGNENDGTAPVYIFQEKEAFDAALAEGMIPVGSLVVKTYDAVEMAGGPFDNALSSESENAVQNKIIKAQVDRLDQAISDALALRASLTEFGLGKICPVSTTDITENNGIVLGGIEKNPAISGTLANQINGIAENLGSHFQVAVTNGISVPNTFSAISAFVELPAGKYIAIGKIQAECDIGLIYENGGLAYLMANARFFVSFIAIGSPVKLAFAAQSQNSFTLSNDGNLNLLQFIKIR